MSMPATAARAERRTGEPWGPGTIALLTAIVAGSVLLRLPFLSVPMITDEGGYAYVAKFWTPEYQLYRDIPFDRPQAIFLLYRLAFLLFGADAAALRLFAALYNGLTVAAMFFLCRRALPLREAWLAAALLAVFSVCPRIEGFTANAETFMLLPLVLSAHFTWRRQWFWAGLAGAMAVLLKPSGASAFLLVLSWLVVTRAAPSAWLRVAAGATLGLSPSVLHGIWVGWPYYWQSIHERRLALYNAETVGLAAQWSALVNGLALTVSSWAFLAVASVLGSMRSRSRETVFGIFWLVFSVVGVAMGGWWREHYFIQLVPPLAFLAAGGLSRLRTTPLRFAWGLALLFGLALFAQRDLALGFQDGPAISWELYRRPGYLLQDRIGAYVKDITGDEDTIYVAFAEAELYYLSGRRAATPQFYFLHAQYSRSVFDGVVAAIRERRPAVVLLVQAPPANQMSAQEFLDILEAGYVKDRVFSVRDDTPSILAFRRREDVRADRQRGIRPAGSVRPSG
jgi:Dolichyl-phosphate-mannose-protein mannosyltransferase